MRSESETERATAAPATAAAVTIVAHDIGGVGGMERQLAMLVIGLIAKPEPTVTV